MRNALIFFGSIAIFVIRGLLLWIVIPSAFCVWLVCVLPLLIVRVLKKSSKPDLSARLWVLWGIQLLDAVICRFVSFGGLIQTPWPWVEPPSRGDEQGIFDVL